MAFFWFFFFFLESANALIIYRGPQRINRLCRNQPIFIVTVISGAELIYFLAKSQAMREDVVANYKCRFELKKFLESRFLFFSVNSYLCVTLFKISRTRVSRADAATPKILFQFRFFFFLLLFFVLFLNYQNIISLSLQSFKQKDVK